MTTRKSSREAFDGEGAKKYGGRWNPKGTPCVYTSGSPSLTLLENLVHFDLDTAPNLYLFSVDIEDHLISPLAKLPGDWEDDERITQEIGRNWILSKSSLILGTSSVIVPQEKNYLVNPTHDLFASLKINEHGEFDVDRRLLR